MPARPRLTSTIHVRVTDDTYRAALQAMEAAGEANISDWTRMIVERAVTEPREADPAPRIVLAEVLALRTIAMNLLWLLHTDLAAGLKLTNPALSSQAMERLIADSDAVKQEEAKRRLFGESPTEAA